MMTSGAIKGRVDAREGEASRAVRLEHRTPVIPTSRSMTVLTTETELAAMWISMTVSARGGHERELQTAMARGALDTVMTTD